MSAWERISFDPFKIVQEILDRLRNEKASEFSVMKVVYSKPRTKCRHEDIAKIGEVETEHD